MQTVIPNQFFGLGDIIFTITLVKRVANDNPILWPVLPHFVEGLNRAYPSIKFVDYRTIPINYESKEHYTTVLPKIGECTILPLRWAGTILKLPYTQEMMAKYMLYGMDWREWKEGAMWERHLAVEQRLSTNLGIGDKECVLINKIFGSDSQLKVNIPVIGGLLNIEMITHYTYSLFDWAHILENASEIHTVSSSILYILELLDIKAPIHLYKRLPIEKDFKNVDYLFTKPYILH